MFGKSNTCVWYVKQYCLMSETILFHPSKSRFRTVKHLFYGLKTIIWWFLPLVCFGRRSIGNYDIDRYASHSPFLLMIFSSQFVYACRRLFPGSDNVYFANRPRRPVLCTNLQLAARKGTLRRFVWHFDKVIVCHCDWQETFEEPLVESLCCELVIFAKNHDWSFISWIFVSRFSDRHEVNTAGPSCGRKIKR